MQRSAIEQELLDTLRNLQAHIETCKASGEPMNLRPLFERLDQLTAGLPVGTSPDLRHYMHKKSYQKAQLWLEGLDPEQGNCPR